MGQSPEELREAACPLAHPNLGFLQWKPGKMGWEEDGLSQGNLLSPGAGWNCHSSFPTLF